MVWCGVVSEREREGVCGLLSVGEGVCVWCVREGGCVCVVCEGGRVCVCGV